MFINPLMLAGIGGAAVPVVLHLLSRARYRSVDWGAMMFLTGVDARQRRGARMKQWTLLAIRASIVAVLAVALARPTVQSRAAGLAGNGLATAVIILDDSASMACVENGRSRLDQAREVALQIISAMNRGDEVSLIPTGVPLSQSERAPTSDLQSVAARVAAVRPGSGQADFTGSLVRAAEVFERYGQQNREIYIICDRQAVSWRRAGGDAFRRAWRSRWTGTQMPRVTVIPVGGDTADNVVVQSLDLLDPPTIKDQPTTVQLRIQNYGSIPHSDLPVTLSVGDRIVAEQTVSLGPDSSATLSATVHFPETGSCVLTASLKAGGLTADNRLDRAIDVIEPLKVLIVSDDAPDDSPAPTHPAQFFTSSAEFIRLALTPFATSRQPGADPVTVTMSTPQRWPVSGLDSFDAIVLADVEGLSPAQSRDLEQYVFAGGGVMIVPGPLSRIDEYNNGLFRFGAGVLPASLSAATSPADDATASVIASIDPTHPVFGFLRDPGSVTGIADAAALQQAATISRYFPATPRSTEARVLASYASGKPFLIEGTAGRGRVLLVTTSLDTDWTTLPQSNLFLPFAQSAIRYLTGGAGAGANNRNLNQNQPLVASIAEPVDEKSGSLLMPSGQTEPVTATRYEDRTEVRFNRTDEPGVYTLRYRSGGAERTLHYVVVAPRAESDLTPLTEEQWASLGSEVGFQRLDLKQSPVASAVARDRSGRELWGALITAVLILVSAEMLLARRWTTMGEAPAQPMPA